MLAPTLSNDWLFAEELNRLDVAANVLTGPLPNAGGWGCWVVDSGAGGADGAYMSAADPGTEAAANGLVGVWPGGERSVGAAVPVGAAAGGSTGFSGPGSNGKDVCAG